MKFASPLSSTEKDQLEQLYKTHPNFRVRQRAQAILLNARGYSIPKLVDLFEVRRNAVSQWIDRWESSGIQGLYDEPRSGRPTIYTDEEANVLKELLNKHPQQLKHAHQDFQNQTEKTSSLDTAKRLIKKKFNYTWKRCRGSLKEQRDEEAFEQEQVIQKALKICEDEGQLQLFYFDESGFSTVPYIPYAWQEKGKTLALPSSRSPRLNIMGFISRNNEAFFYPHEGSVRSAQVIQAFDAFAREYAPIYRETQRPCLVILDNASMHVSHAFWAKRDEWLGLGVALHYLPPYSPELNIIEILWRKIKYEWLPLGATKSYENLKNEVMSILNKIGEKYTINFA